MTVVNIPSQDIRLTDAAAIAGRLAEVGIDYERWENIREVSPDATDQEILEAYSAEIERLKTAGGYVTADVINVVPTTPGLDQMLNKFNKEHWHDEDEVRFIVEGRGLYHVHPVNGQVFAIEVEAGDLIRVPRGTHH